MAAMSRASRWLVEESEDIPAVSSAAAEIAADCTEEIGAHCNPLASPLLPPTCRGLLEAAFHARTDELKRLLDDPDVNPNDTDQNGNTALIFAAANGRTLEVMLLLRDERVDVNVANGDGCTALMYALSEKCRAATILLLETCRRSRAYHSTALSSSSSSSSSSPPLGIDLSAEAASDPPTTTRGSRRAGSLDTNLGDAAGATALHRAAAVGDTEAMTILLEADLEPRLNLNAVTKRGRTPLMMAAEHGHEAMVLLLLADGRVEVDFAVQDGNTALIAASREGHPAVVKLFLGDLRVNVNFAGRNGNTALIVSASGGHASVVGLLLQPRGPLVARTMALIQAAVARRTAARASSARFRGLVKLAIELRRRRLRAAEKVYAVGGTGFAAASINFATTAAASAPTFSSAASAKS